MINVTMDKVPILVPIYSLEVKELVEKLDSMLKQIVSDKAKEVNSDVPSVILTWDQVMTDVESSRKIQAILKEIDRVYSIAVPIDYIYKENAREDQLVPYKVRKVTDYL
ncbi:MAG: hypothetical protein CL760_09675 [Chloroflexi bacterium]|nr:hypothetical protein [Chloroflexota bacterium]|tara:strand:- start:6354 stop:6680 length:327 start_codon:yes stop_codon:yes gene_type:complete